MEHSPSRLVAASSADARHSSRLSQPAIALLVLLAIAIIRIAVLLA